jgi:hypothetical protein
MNSMPSTGKTDRPPLPEGWVYADDVEWQGPPEAPPSHKRALVAVVVAFLVACAVGLVVGNAQVHYSRGVAALHKGDYVRAQAELAGARLVLLPYRDSTLLAEQAGDQVRLDAANTFAAGERADAVDAALDSATAALQKRDADGFTDALVSVSAADLRKVVGSDSDEREAEQKLTEGVTAIVQTALKARKWDTAQTWAAALAALQPGSTQAADMALRAKKGRELSTRLADARDAARRGEWRKALRLALGVAAVRRGFPGTSTLIAEARRKLAPKKTKTASTATAATQTSTTGSTTSSGSPSGSSSGSSQPPPP